MKIRMDSDVSVELTRRGLAAYKNTIERITRPIGDERLDIATKKNLENGAFGVLDGNVLSCELWQLFRLFGDEIDCCFKLFFEYIDVPNN